MAAFFPAIQKDILVQPGTQSLMAVHLSSFFSTIQLSYPPLENGSLMTDDWKWVLRTATSTRPVMRFAGDLDQQSTEASAARSAILRYARHPDAFGRRGRRTTTGVSQSGGHGYGLRAGYLHPGQQYVAGERQFGNTARKPACPRPRSAPLTAAM
jgi:hypothetical protein